MLVLSGLSHLDDVPLHEELDTTKTLALCSDPEAASFHVLVLERHQ